MLKKQFHEFSKATHPFIILFYSLAYVGLELHIHNAINSLVCQIGNISILETFYIEAHVKRVGSYIRHYCFIWVKVLYAPDIEKALILSLESAISLSRT